MRERERERERERDRETERQTETKRQRETERTQNFITQGLRFQAFACSYNLSSLQDNSKNVDYHDNNDDDDNDNMLMTMLIRNQCQQ